MLLSKTLSTLLLAGGVSCASSLAVYQDKTFYSFSPKNNFIGFTQASSVKCEGRTIALSTMIHCPEDDRLCKTLTTLKSTSLELDGIQANIKMLDQLVSLPKPATIDASAWISAAKLLSEEQTNLFAKKTVLSKKVAHQQELFLKQAPTKNALQSIKTCNTDIELSIPYGDVTFSTSYEANIVDNKEVTVTQNLSIVNRSGVDIEADTAMFYYRQAQQYVNPVHFTPWLVSKYVPRTKRVYKKSVIKRKSVAMDMMEEEAMMTSTVAKSVPIVSYEDAREYKIEHLTLPSTGVPLDVEVATWKAALSCEVRAFPYVNTRAFHVCTFEPKYQIDSHRWKIKSGKKIINENGVGTYKNDKYLLYTQIEEDIKIVRRPIVQKERETGIFGSTVRKKDGFVLTLTNKSSKEKILTLIERIPTSTTDEIKSKLLGVNSTKKVNYKVLKDGKLEMKIKLAANESKHIEVMFEISYDKDLKVSY